MLLRIVFILKLVNYFWIFPFNHFRLWLITGSCNYGSQNNQEEDYVLYIYFMSVLRLQKRSHKRVSIHVQSISV